MSGSQFVMNVAPGAARLLRPNTSPPNPKADRMMENTSIGTGRGVVTFCTRRKPSTSAPMAIGRTRMNIHRHESVLRMMPEMVGPIAGATEMTIEMLPIVRPRTAGGTTVMTVVMSSGIMMAVPVACTMRPTSSTSKPGAIAAMSVPSENQRHRRDEHRAGVEALQQESRDRNDDGHGEHECGGKPLRRHLGDCEVGDEVRDGDAHDGLVEDHHEGRDEQQVDDELVAAIDGAWCHRTRRSRMRCRRRRVRAVRSRRCPVDEGGSSRGDGHDDESEVVEENVEHSLPYSTDIGIRSGHPRCEQCTHPVGAGEWPIPGRRPLANPVHQRQALGCEPSRGACARLDGTPPPVPKAHSMTEAPDLPREEIAARLAPVRGATQPPHPRRQRAHTGSGVGAVHHRALRSHPSG